MNLAIFYFDVLKDCLKFRLTFDFKCFIFYGFFVFEI